MPKHQALVWFNGVAMRSASQPAPGGLSGGGDASTVDQIAFNQFLSGDRGLHYGHGLFETMTVKAGKIAFFNLHLQRLKDGLNRLKLLASAEEASLYVQQLQSTMQHLLFPEDRGVLKLIVSAGSLPFQGYAADPGQHHLQTVIRWSPALYSKVDSESVLRVLVCSHRLPRQPALAGLKHLNRLDQVLAATEVRQAGFGEGIVCDMQGVPVEATASNIFIVKAGHVKTPCLHYAGVAGVLRQAILNLSTNSNWLDVTVTPLKLEDIFQADEVFITNMVRGVRSVGCVASSQGHFRYAAGPIAQKLSLWFEALR